MDTSWIAPLLSRPSLGSQGKGDGTLAGLHRAREQHLGQFFTPLPVVSMIWQVLSPVVAALAGRGRVSLLDNSCGTGRLFAHATPETFSLFGCDVHESSIAALRECAEKAGIVADLYALPMEQMRFRQIDLAIINPPFSLHLESPTLEPFECCSFGRFGPRTSCLSHAYALAQALDAASYVAAILPRTFAAELSANPEWRSRLTLLAHLPAGSFREEGTEVSTSVAFFDASPTRSFSEVHLRDMSTAPDAAFTAPLPHASRTPKAHPVHLEDEGPAITLPVTGNATVRICHQRRKILLGFQCGFTEARVRNAILEDRVRVSDLHRQPRSLPFVGSARLNLDTFAIQEDPMGALQEQLVDRISQAGGVVEFAPGFLAYFQRFCRRLAVHRTPFRHVLFREGASKTQTGTAVAKATVLINPKSWSSPVVPKGATVSFEQKDGLVIARRGSATWTGPYEDFIRLYTPAQSTPEAGAWEVKYEGRPAAFPQIAATYRARATRLGIDRWLHPFQLHDVIEMTMSPFGACGALHMGLGKARIAIALCLMSSAPRSLIAVEPHLVDEMVSELRKLAIDPSLWQVVTTIGQARAPRQINVISYARLRTRIAPGCRKTYAHLLRGQIGLAVADEGHLLRNATTEQSRALSVLGARRRFVLTGTPIANYPRNTLPIMTWLYGEGNAVQPYGIQAAFLEPRLLTSASFAQRGADRFREDFTTEEWCTNEFAEDLESGAKREIPSIKNPATYRAWVAPLIKRRTHLEPDVAQFVRIPTPSIHVHDLPFDPDHFDYYFEVAQEFRQHYIRAKQEAGSARSLNLVALLARIGAVEAALNVPHRGSETVRPFRGEPSAKYRKAVELCSRFASEGRKTIVFCHSPDAATALARLLEGASVESVVLHGKIAQADRTEALFNRFRMGSAPVLIATKGVARTGLNIPEASRVVFLDRAWTSSIEDQAMARVLRPQQKEAVEVHFLHLSGSLDDYQAQMVAHKREAAAVGLDWVTPSLASQDFLHMDTILGRFAESVGVTAGSLRRGLAFAA